MSDKKDERLTTFSLAERLKATVDLNFQAYGELESKRLYDVSVNTLREEK